jgi:hypothetical protein
MERGVIPEKQSWQRKRNGETVSYWTQTVGDILHYSMDGFAADDIVLR